MCAQIQLLFIVGFKQCQQLIIVISYNQILIVWLVDIKIHVKFLRKKTEAKLLGLRLTWLSAYLDSFKS